MIACCYDLVRACCLQKAVPGKPFLSADEFYKRTVRLQVNDACELFSPQVLEERGEYCSLELPSGTVCILDGGQMCIRDRCTVPAEEKEKILKTAEKEKGQMSRKAAAAHSQ